MENRSLPTMAQQLRQKKAHVELSVQKIQMEARFNMTDFYDYLLKRMDILAVTRASIPNPGFYFKEEISKACALYQIPLVISVNGSFNLRDIFPFLGENLANIPATVHLPMVMENFSLPVVVQKLREKKMQVEASVQRLQMEARFNMIDFYDYLLKRMEILAAAGASIPDHGLYLREEIAKASTLYQMPLEMAVNEAFNLQGIFAADNGQNNSAGAPHPENGVNSGTVAFLEEDEIKSEYFTDEEDLIPEAEVEEELPNEPEADRQPMAEPSVQPAPRSENPNQPSDFIKREIDNNHLAVVLYQPPWCLVPGNHVEHGRIDEQDNEESNVVEDDDADSISNEPNANEEWDPFEEQVNMNDGEDNEDEEEEVEDDSLMNEEDSSDKEGAEEEEDENDVNSNNSDNVSIKTEIESECDSTDSDSSDEEEEEELTAAFKEEIGDGHAKDQIIGNSDNENENDDDEQLSEAVITEASNEQGHAGPSIVSKTEATLTRRSTRASAAKRGNYADAMENSLSAQQGTLTGTRKRSIGRSGKSIAPKRSQVGPAQPVSADLQHQVNADSEDEEDDGDSNEDEDVEEEEPIAQDIAEPSTSTGRRSARIYARVSQASSNSQDGQATRRVSKRQRVPGQAATGVDIESAVATEALSVVTKKLKCTVPGCKKVVKSKNALNRHLLSSHQLKKYRCLVRRCHGKVSTSFSIKSQLTDHFRQAHRRVTKWTCKCAKKFKSYRKLYSHYWGFHELGHFACSVDGCTFKWATTRVKVESHLRNHGEAKYECPADDCERSFKRKDHLDQHILTHTGERPFPCLECDKSFSNKSNLNRHLRMHRNAKCYRCTWLQCAYSSSDYSAVIKHIRTVHFKLPRTKEQQTEEGIMDDRDPRDYLAKD